jgi:hypothetical protein
LVTNGAVSSSSALSSSSVPPKKVVDVAVSTTIKDRLSSLHQQVSSPVDEASKRILDTPFKNVHEARNEFELKQQQHLLPQSSVVSHTRASEVSTLLQMENDESQRLSDHDDSGINEHYQTRPDVIQHESIIVDSVKDNYEDPNDEESSVSFRNEQIQSMVMVLSLNDNNNSTTNNISSNNSVAADAATVPMSPSRKSLASDAMMNFIHSNYQPFDGEEANDDGLHNTTHANYYAHEATTQRNELMKSNSVDTAISLCSSSDGTNLTD